MYKLLNDKEFTPPENCVRMAHYIGSVGKREFELIADKEQHFYGYEVGENRMMIIHLTLIKSIRTEEVWNASIRMLRCESFHIRVHDEHFDRYLEEMMGG